MKSVCAWCGEDLGRVACGNLPEEAVTHGICPQCANQLFADMGVPLQTFMDSLDVPVLLVDENVRVRGANAQACALVQKPLTEIQGHLGGEVFECAYSRLAGGCGGTVHCSGCAIRRSVSECFTTGKSQLRVAATLKPQLAESSPVTSLLITTQKIDEHVLLSIESVETDSGQSLGPSA